MAAPGWNRGRHPRHDDHRTVVVKVTALRNRLQTRSAAITAAESLDEADMRLDAAASVLAQAALGRVSAHDVLEPAIRLMERARHFIAQARGGGPL